jgi:uncharacterized DUF497 family protein
MNFEWDPEKAKTNAVKHGVTFERARLIFADPDMITIPDVDHSDEEDREISLGMEPLGQTLVVVHTTRLRIREEWTRIISARRANKKEAEVYYARKETE